MLILGVWGFLLCCFLLADLAPFSAEHCFEEACQREVKRQRDKGNCLRNLCGHCLGFRGGTRGWVLELKHWPGAEIQAALVSLQQTLDSVIWTFSPPVLFALGGLPS